MRHSDLSEIKKVDVDLLNISEDLQQTMLKSVCAGLKCTALGGSLVVYQKQPYPCVYICV